MEGRSRSSGYEVDLGEQVEGHKWSSIVLTNACFIQGLNTTKRYAHLYITPKYNSQNNFTDNNTTLDFSKRDSLIWHF